MSNNLRRSSRNHAGFREFMEKIKNPKIEDEELEAPRRGARNSHPSTSHPRGRGRASTGEPEGNDSSNAVPGPVNKQQALKRGRGRPRKSTPAEDAVNHVTPLLSKTGPILVIPPRFNSATANRSAPILTQTVYEVGRIRTLSESQAKVPEPVSIVSDGGGEEWIVEELQRPNSASMENLSDPIGNDGVDDGDESDANGAEDEDVKDDESDTSEESDESDAESDRSGFRFGDSPSPPRIPPPTQSLICTRLESKNIQRSPISSASITIPPGASQILCVLGKSPMKFRPSAARSLGVNDAQSSSDGSPEPPPFSPILCGEASRRATESRSPSPELPAVSVSTRDVRMKAVVQELPAVPSGSIGLVGEAEMKVVPSSGGSATGTGGAPNAAGKPATQTTRPGSPQPAVPATPIASSGPAPPTPVSRSMENIEEIHVDSDAASAHDSDSDSSSDNRRIMRRSVLSSDDSDDEVDRSFSCVPSSTKPAPPLRSSSTKIVHPKERTKHKKKRSSEDSKKKKSKHRSRSSEKRRSRSKAKEKDEDKEKKEEENEREKSKQKKAKEEKESLKKEKEEREKEKKVKPDEKEKKVKEDVETADDVSKETEKPSDKEAPASDATDAKASTPVTKDKGKPTNSALSDKKPGEPAKNMQGKKAPGTKPGAKVSLSSKIQSQLQKGKKEAVVTDVVGAILNLNPAVNLPPPKPKPAPKEKPSLPQNRYPLGAPLFQSRIGRPSPQSTPLPSPAPSPVPMMAMGMPLMMPFIGPPPMMLPQPGFLPVSMAVPTSVAAPPPVVVSPPVAAPPLPLPPVIPKIPSFSTEDLKAILAATVIDKKPAEEPQPQKPPQNTNSFWEATAASTAVPLVRPSLPAVISRLAAENSDSDDDYDLQLAILPPVPEKPPPPQKPIAAELKEVLESIKSGRLLSRLEPKVEPPPPPAPVPQAEPQKETPMETDDEQRPAVSEEPATPPVYEQPETIKLNISTSSLKKLFAGKEEKVESIGGDAENADQEDVKEKQVIQNGFKEESEFKTPLPVVTVERYWSGEAVDVTKEVANFQLIESNLYLTDKIRNKEKIICECTLTVEELQAGIVGCGDNCLNRILLIECCSKCPLGALCTNKNFTQKKNSKVEVFRTHWKGLGLRALEPIPAGKFIIEYVGEVIGHNEFEKRLIDMNARGENHFYFMGLRQDQFVDSLKKGNASRFINHSCDPNAQTEKWTVGGELRVGFFSKKDINAGEEITFDYQLQNYGREAQKCFCGTSKCRGVLGKSKKVLPSSKGGKAYYTPEDDDLEEELDALCQIGVKRRETALRVARLMVRAEDLEARLCLLRLIDNTDASLHRCYLEFHVFKLIASWMQNYTPPEQSKDAEGLPVDLREEVLSVLSGFNISYINYVEEAKIHTLLERWCGFSYEEVFAVASELERGDDAPVEEPKDSFVPAVTTNDARTVKLRNILEAKSEDEYFAENRVENDLKARLAYRSAHLLSSWRALPRLFRIPKVSKIEPSVQAEPTPAISPVIGVAPQTTSTTSSSSQRFDRDRFTRSRTMDMKRRLLQEALENRLNKRNVLHDEDWARQYALNHGMEQDYQLYLAHQQMMLVQQQWTLPHPSGEGFFVPDPTKCPFCVPCRICHPVIPVIKKCKYVDDLEEDDELAAAAAAFDQQIPSFSPPQRDEDSTKGSQRLKPEEVVKAQPKIAPLRSPMQILQLKWWKRARDSNDRFYFWQGSKKSKWKPRFKKHMMSEILSEIENADKSGRLERRSKLVQEIPEPSYWDDPVEPEPEPEPAEPEEPREPFADVGVQADADVDVPIPAPEDMIDIEIQTSPSIRLTDEELEAAGLERDKKAMMKAAKKEERRGKGSKRTEEPKESEEEDEKEEVEMTEEEADEKIRKERMKAKMREKEMLKRRAGRKRPSSSGGASPHPNKRKLTKDEVERRRKESRTEHQRSKDKAKMQQHSPRLDPRLARRSSSSKPENSNEGSRSGASSSRPNGREGATKKETRPEAPTDAPEENGIVDPSVAIPGLDSPQKKKATVNGDAELPSAILVDQFKAQVKDMVSTYVSEQLGSLKPEIKKKMRPSLEYAKICGKITQNITDKELMHRAHDSKLVVSEGLKNKIKEYIGRYIKNVVLVSTSVSSTSGNENAGGEDAIAGVEGAGGAPTPIVQPGSIPIVQPELPSTEPVEGDAL